jgi:hypothetical protein
VPRNTERYDQSICGISKNGNKERSLSVIKFLCVVNELRKHMFSVRFFSPMSMKTENKSRPFLHIPLRLFSKKLLGSALFMRLRTEHNQRKDRRKTFILLRYFGRYSGRIDDAPSKCCRRSQAWTQPLLCSKKSPSRFGCVLRNLSIDVDRIDLSNLFLLLHVSFRNDF